MSFPPSAGMTKIWEAVDIKKTHLPSGEHLPDQNGICPDSTLYLSQVPASAMNHVPAFMILTLSAFHTPWATGCPSAQMAVFHPRVSSASCSSRIGCTP